MELRFEQSLLQNDAFSAALLSVAVRSFYDQTDRKTGLPLLLSVLVLPLSYHKETTETLISKRRPSLFAKAIASNRDIPLGLQQRMQEMTDMSMSALRLAIAASALAVDDTGTNLELVPVGTLPPTRFTSADAKRLRRAAKTIGQALAELSLEQVCQFLMVRF